MMAPIQTFDGEEFLSSHQASDEFGYSQDYIGQLARGEKVKGKKVGKTWYVSRKGIESYLRQVEQIRQEVGGRPRTRTFDEHGDQVEHEAVSKQNDDAPEHETEAVAEDEAVPALRHEPQFEIRYVQDEGPLIPMLKKQSSSNTVPLQQPRAVSRTKAVAADISRRASETVDRPERITSVAHAAVPFAHTADIIQRMLFLLLLTLFFSGSVHAVQTGVVAPTPARIAAGWSELTDTAVVSTALGSVSNLSHALAAANLSFSEHLKNIATSPATLFSLLFGSDDEEVAPITETPPLLTDAEREELTRRLTSTTTSEANGGVALISDNEKAREERESSRPTTVVQQPVIERIIETERIIRETGLSEEEIQRRLSVLEGKLSAQIFALEGQTSDNATKIVNQYTTISQTNKIDDLGSVTIHDSSITNTSISGSSSFSGTSVSATSGSFGSLSVSGALTGASGSFSGEVSVNNIVATGTATSSFAGAGLFTKAPTVPHTFGSWVPGATGAAAETASLVVNPSSAVADSNLLALAVAGAAKFLVDAEGDVFVNSLTSVGSVTLSTTTASTFSVEGNTTLGDSITDVTTINGTLNVTGTTTASSVAGNFGVGTSTPAWKLAVEGIGSFDDYVRASYFIATSTSATSTFAGGLAVETSGFVYDFSTNNVGIGTDSPAKRLSIIDTVADAQLSVAYDATRYANFQVDSVGDLIIDPQGDDVFLNDDNLYVCSGGSCPAGTPAGTGNIIAESNLGVGTSTPSAQFAVANNLFVGGGGSPALGTATSTYEGDIIIHGKLDVGTIDPVYTIAGVKYATYGHSTIGIKEEVVQKIAVDERNNESGRYEYIIDFDEVLRGSDLWLFYQVTDFGRDWRKLVVTLTPGFRGNVSYREDVEENRLIIESDRPGTLSLRLIADRFDASKWPNLRPDQNEGFRGHIIPEKK